MTILCLCREEHHWKLIPGYAAAFRRKGVAFHFAGDSIPFDTPLSEVLRTCTETPAAIFHFESAHPLLPQDIYRSEIPTFCFHPDTYAFTERRIRWSSLFDQAAVFHPGYVERFVAGGHPGAFLLPHAVRREYFDLPESQREFEIGWVGQTSGPFYRNRARWLPELQREFRTNDWNGARTIEEVAQIYRRSRVVVNIGRDDFPQDANLRVFEVLASGALLLTGVPSELTELGFQENIHFAGYRNGAEISGLVRKYLSDEAARLKISEAARALVLSEHTYDRRAELLLERIANAPKIAPARFVPDSHARLAVLDFYAAHGLTGLAGRQFQHVAGHGFRETMEAASLLSRSYLKSLLRR
jgi:hypothetical protein